MSAWQIENVTASTKPLKIIIKEEKADKVRRDSINSTQSENSFSGLEFETRSETKQLSYDLQDDLNLFFDSFRDDGKRETDRKIEDHVIRQLDKSNGKYHDGKTGKFKQHCKSAKYQNKVFLNEPIIETPFNRDADRIEEWFKCW